MLALVRLGLAASCGFDLLQQINIQCEMGAAGGSFSELLPLGRLCRGVMFSCSGNRWVFFWVCRANYSCGGGGHAGREVRFVSRLFFAVMGAPLR